MLTTVKPDLGPADDTTAASAFPWHRAASLSERAATSRGRFIPCSPAAQRRVERWRSGPAFTEPGTWERRLAAAGLTELDLSTLLDDATTVDTDQPAWAAEILAAYDPDSSPAATYFPLPTTEAFPLADFLTLIASLIDRARRRVRSTLQAQLDRNQGPAFDPTALEASLFAPIPERLIRVLSRTLALELQVSRLENRLPGETSAERFAAFVAQLRRPERALAIFSEYPVLARQAVEILARWETASRECLAHLATDWPTLRAGLLTGDDPGLLVSIEFGAGDTHRGGRSVAILTFAFGARLVFKPRSLAVDATFGSLLHWLNARAAGSDVPSFQPIRVLDRGDHGWVEFVSPAPVPDEAAIERYYRRFGANLALLYALEATDFHYENIFAAGEYPLLLDLEALFVPRLLRFDRGRAGELAVDALDRTVLRCGLLPREITAGSGDAAGLDVSAIGAGEPQRTPFTVPRWHGAGTDNLQLVREHGIFRAEGHRPTLDVAPADPLDHVEAIAAGFTAAYRLLEREREGLLAPDGPLAAFAKAEVRVILRHTRSYFRLLDEGFHPDVLRDALDRDRLLDRLWAGVPDEPGYERVVLAEQAAIRAGDIPAFTTRPGETALRTDAGEVIPNFCPASGLDLVRERLLVFSDDDLARQLWFIHASLSTVAPLGQTSKDPFRPYPEHPAGPPATTERFLAATRSIGEQIKLGALRGDGDAAWIGISLVGDAHYRVAPLGLDLYDGLPGVALFLAQLGALTNDAEATDLARAAVRTIFDRVTNDTDELTSPGVFDGWGGIVYALARLAALWQDPDLIAATAPALDRLAEAIERTESADVVSGLAGAIAALLALHTVAPATNALQLAVRAGDRLLELAVPQSDGIGWLAGLEPRQPLTGFSHGAAGIAASLLRLSAASGQVRFRAAALAAIAFERTRFFLELGNWSDLRTGLAEDATDDGPITQVSWCHGAVGIGLARLATLHLLDDGEIRDEIATAVQTTLDYRFFGSHGLCHGAFGNLELLMTDEARRRGGEEARSTGANSSELVEWSTLLLERLEASGPVCSNRLGVESPGLMTGLSGIGYALLRLAAPNQVPSILALDPPPAPTSRLLASSPARLS